MVERLRSREVEEIVGNEIMDSENHKASRCRPWSRLLSIPVIITNCGI